jgi:hypothetical protein
VYPKWWWYWQPQQHNYTSWQQDSHAIFGKYLKILLVHVVVAALSQKRLVLDLNTPVEVTETSEKDKLTVE